MLRFVFRSVVLVTARTLGQKLATDMFEAVLPTDGLCHVIEDFVSCTDFV